MKKKKLKNGTQVFLLSTFRREWAVLEKGALFTALGQNKASLSHAQKDRKHRWLLIPAHKAQGQTSPCALCRCCWINRSWFWMLVSPSPWWSLHIDNSSPCPDTISLQPLSSCHAYISDILLSKGRADGGQGKPVCWPTGSHFMVDKREDLEMRGWMHLDLVRPGSPSGPELCVRED